MRPFVLALAIAIVPSACCSASEPPTYFSIKMQEKLIGYAEVNRETVQQDGRALLRLTSQTSLKVALLGKERQTVLDFETFVEPTTGHPVRYRMTDTTNDVIRHVESDFTDGIARTWSYRDGEDRGEPLETEFPDGTLILGSNNFAHWQLMMDAAQQQVANERVELSVFLPDAGLIDRFYFVRGQPQEITAGGEIRTCVSWNLPKANLNAFVDSKTNEFVRLELPAQQTTIERTDANIIKLAQKSRAEEVLARHFVQSNIVFDDFMKVDFVKAELDVTVIGSGVATETSALNTAMQTFDGTKDRDHIAGEVTIRSVSFDDKESLAFPATADDPELKGWLNPSVYIESDHAPIGKKAAELTKDAKTRWQAVQNIGKWVHQEIAYTIADTPSAQLAFEKKQGDCGPHSTLMVAMLRASGIPARLVGGLVYTPSFGGSFGQHAWVEVHMGKSGWIAIDPTTGEFDQMSASHIKLFEGLGGVIPKSIKVTEFTPPNAEPTSAEFAEAKPITWEFGQPYTFKYKQGEKELGSETFTIEEVEQDGVDAYKLESETSLKINLLTSIKTNTTVVVARNARPIEFTQTLSALLQNVKISCSFKDGTVNEEISGTTNLSREIKLPAGTYCFDNNLMGSWALICSQLKLEPGKSIQLNTYHPSTLQIIPLTFTPKDPAVIQIAGEEVECYECSVEPIKNTFWIARDGRFVRAKQGDLVIELVE